MAGFRTQNLGGFTFTKGKGLALGSGPGLGQDVPGALFQAPDLTDQIIREVANQERMRNRIGRTRASTFFGGQALAQPILTRRSLFKGYGTLAPLPTQLGLGTGSTPILGGTR